jgi:uncharacterized protein (TIGR03118 family)
MNALGQHAGWRRGLDLVELDRGRARRRRSRRLCRGLWCECLENRTLLATTANSIENLTGLAIFAVQNMPIPQNVATFQSADAAAVPSDFTATINWGDGTAPSPGTVTEDSQGIFHVNGSHDYTESGSFTPVVTIEDTNGAVDATGAFYQTNLVSSVAGNAAIQDTNLINPWGLSNSTYTWAADEGSGRATVYDLSGPKTQSTIVAFPSGHPTGILYNTDPVGFDVAPSTPAQFLFATLGGTIDGWAAGGSATTLATVAGAELTGLASAGATTGSTVLNTTPYLYATDFTGTTGAHGIDVFNSSFNSVTGPGGSFNGKFSDPNLPTGFEPFNVIFAQPAGSAANLFVAYAKPSGSGSLTGTGGYIDEFDTSGNLIKTIDSDPAGTNLNGPWGMVIAPPQGFGPFNNDLLVGNFGGGSGTAPGGTITAINLTTDTVVGTIDGANGSALVNPGLWGLLSNWQYLPGPPFLPLSLDSLYVSAGIDSQSQGLLAQIWFAPAASATVVGLSPHNPQPTVAATAGQLFAGPVAFFTASDTSQTESTFNATIDWGDGTSESPGTIIPLSAASGSGGLFEIVGVHIYSSAGVYAIGADVEVHNLLSLGINNTANVSDGSHVTLTVTGKLKPASDSDVSSTADITNVVRPNFIGTASQPDAAVSLFATSAGRTTPVLIGMGTANADGAWSITAGQALADGSYAITAVAVSPSGQAFSGTTTIAPDLVIDTVGPNVTGLAVDRRRGRIVVAFQDFGGLNNMGVGLDMASIIYAGNYQLVALDHPRVPAVRLTIVSVTSGTTGRTESVTLKVTGRTCVLGGPYSLRIDSASPTDPSGIQDNAANALDGEFSGTFPSGNGVPGGDFVARLSAIAPTRPMAARNTAEPIQHKAPAVVRSIQPVRVPIVSTSRTLSSSNSTRPVTHNTLDQALEQSGKSRKIRNT